MKSTIAALTLSAFAILAFANDGYRSAAGESEADNVVKVQVGMATDNDQYRNQAGEQDQHQPQVG